MQLLGHLPVHPRTTDWLRRAGRVGPARSALRAVTAPSTHERWLFMVGCYNSGTTIFHDVFAQHPQVASLPGEGAFLTDELHPPEAFGSVRLIFPVQDQMAAADANASVERLRADWGIFLDNDRPVAIEKSISNVARIPWLAQAFPQARFVGIRRDGRAVAEGIRRRAGAGAYKLDDGEGSHDIGDCARQWVHANDLLAEAQGALATDRYTEITYEDFCVDPGGTLNAVAAFGGLDEFAFDTSSIANQNERSIGRLSAADLDTIESIAGPMLRSFGYV